MKRTKQLNDSRVMDASLGFTDIIIIISCHRFFLLPWYFCSWASCEPHHSGFKSQLVALSLWCVMFLVWLLFSRYFCKLLLTIPLAPMIAGMTNHFMFHILWISILTFLYLIYFQLPFVLHSYLMVLLHQSTNQSINQYYYYYYYYYYFWVDAAHNKELNWITDVVSL
jgi:hypothetical protein